MFETVLFPIDQPCQTIDTANTALEFEGGQRRRLILLIVEDKTLSNKNDSAAIKSLSETIAKRFQVIGIGTEIMERAGNPPFVICDVAAENNVDLIVMGTKGINLEQDKGSTAVRVIQLAPCPVLVVS